MCLWKKNKLGEFIKRPRQYRKYCLGPKVKNILLILVYQHLQIYGK